MKLRLSIHTLLIAWNEGSGGQATGIGCTQTRLAPIICHWHRWKLLITILEAVGCTAVPENVNLESLGGEFKWARDQPECWFEYFRQNCLWTAGFDPGWRTWHSNVIFMRENKVFSQSLNLCRHCSVFRPVFFFSLCVYLIPDLPEGKKTKYFIFWGLFCIRLVLVLGPLFTYNSLCIY